MKKKPMTYSGLSDEVDLNVPNYKTVISISSMDQLNITLSKCGLSMLSNLGVVRTSVHCCHFSFKEMRIWSKKLKRLNVVHQIIMLVNIYFSGFSRFLCFF